MEDKKAIERKEIDRILKLYDKSEVCIGELLSHIKVPKEFTYEQAFEMYIKIMHRIEEDRFFTIKEDEIVELTKHDDI